MEQHWTMLHAWDPHDIPIMEIHLYTRFMCWFLNFFIAWNLIIMKLNIISLTVLKYMGIQERTTKNPCEIRKKNKVKKEQHMMNLHEIATLHDTVPKSHLRNVHYIFLFEKWEQKVKITSCNKISESSWGITNGNLLSIIYDNYHLQLRTPETKSK